MAETDKTETGVKSPGESTEDQQATLADLTARAAAKDAIKDFESAAELYSQAMEIQAELNGELSNDNADLLFAYGKSLYNVAVAKSDVLGSKVAGESSQAPAESATAGNVASAGSSATEGGDLIKKAVAGGTGKDVISNKGQENDAKTTQNQPYFQFAGDENFDDSEEEDDDEADKAGGGEEDEDDFANAFEVLDMARILYSRKLELGREGQGNGKSSSVPPEIRHVEERLADTYDLQAEISLEAERFADAVADLRTALEMKQSLYPIEDPSIAECHYKLSLALEFASVNNENSDGNDATKRTSSNADEGMRKEAVDHMETAIESCKVRTAQEQKKLDTGDIMGEDKVTAAKKRIANVKEILADMEQRVSFLTYSGHLASWFAYILL